MHYLFEFLDAYDFGAEGSAEIQEQNKTIINASVLGLIFEKINGYKDGSFFTPGFITMYMCRETIRRAVLRKFNEKYGWSCSDFTDLYNTMDKVSIKEANEVINSLKICDPAVGSGHFLVSALNEIIAIKSDLGILADKDGRRLRDYRVQIENDELIVTVDDHFFEYNYKDPESQRVQETLFHEKETLIENCLFGVDINPKSVMICRLRLWIELLKHAYYRADMVTGHETRQLETLPNIDINIKCGNSLVSRFAVSGNPNILPGDRRKLKELTEKYRRHVSEYKLSPANKAQLRIIIDNLKEDLQNFGLSNDRDLAALRRKQNELAQLSLFAYDKKEAAARQKLHDEVDELERRFAEKQNSIYRNAFEWRFEFPEVLDENGEFVGFDVVIGNPPYIRQEAIKEMKPALTEMFGGFFCGTADIYTYFYKTGLDVAKPGATLCYIAPNKFMRAGYGKNTRELLTTHAKPLMVLDFGDLPVFEEATTYPSIVMVGKKAPPPQPSPAGGGSSAERRNRLSPPPSGGRPGGGKSRITEKKLFIPVPVPTPLLEAARTLRSTMTDAEQLLWQYLRGKQLGGYRFRRQRPIERFVLDFYCCEAKLAVELDGGQHNEADVRTRDEERTATLGQHGIQVIRFWNSEVFSNLEGVLEEIYQALQQRTSLSPPLPASPLQGEEIKSSLPQRGRVGEGDVFLAATFNDTEQLTYFAEALPNIGFTMPVSALKPEGWTLERPEVLGLMEKLRMTGKPLGDFVEGKFYYGIKTGLNEAFVIDEETRQRLNFEDPKSAEIIKPWLRGRDIRKWKAEPSGVYIIYIPWHFEIEKYPAIQNHLLQFKDNLEKRNEAIIGCHEWYALQRYASDYIQEFNKKKIIYQVFQVKPLFMIDTEGTLTNNASYIIPDADEYLLAYLNSKLGWYMIDKYCSHIQNGYQLMASYFAKSLIYPANDAQKAPIIERVQKILADPDSSDVPRLEAEIDQLVYELYGLTEEEIALVEGKA